MKNLINDSLAPLLIILSLLILLQLSTLAHAEGAGIISGKVIGSEAQQALSYAEIILTRQEDGAPITGAITGNDGQFELTGIPDGTFKAEVYFVGFEPHFVENIIINRDQARQHLGTITITSQVISGEAVEVEGRRAAVTYQIDRKVVDVGESITAASGNAADVLKNVPSISVDIDGNVRLRGSSNFRVLIDGRPSVLDANDALQQIPAASIDNIEIVTNPSARYDPEGTAGLLNIILKKQKRQQTSGLLGLNAGLDDKYGMDFIYNIKREKLGITLGADYNRRFSPSEQIEENQTTINGAVSSINSRGVSTRGRLNGGFRGGLSYDITSQQLLNAEFRYGQGEFGGEGSLDYQEDAGLRQGPTAFNSRTDRVRMGEYFSSTLSYQHYFSPRKDRSKSHLLSVDAQYSRYNGDEESLNELRNASGAQISGQRSTEVGPSLRFQGRLDYTLPLGGERALEAGYHLTDQSSEDETALYLFDTDRSEYVFQPEFANFTDYNRTIHAAYAIFAGKAGNLGYQAGLRGEYTDRRTSFGETSPAVFAVNRRDLFPSAHFSYQIESGQQFMASYSRRIERPRGWYLEPFITYTDAYNVRSGNPQLTPEYIDSYELGAQTFLGKNVLSAELYYRIGRDRIERVQSVFAENITLRRPVNVGTDYALGSELMFNADLNKRWNINVLGNIYNYRIEGILNDEAFDRESFNWSARLNNSFSLTDKLQIQFNSRYNSATVSSQGREEGYYTADLAIRQVLLDKRVTATLQVNDIFGTQKFERISRGAGFYNRDWSDSESPVIMMNVRINFNNFKAPRQDRRGGGSGEF